MNPFVGLNVGGEGMPASVQRHTGTIPVRLEGNPRLGPFAGQTTFRSVVRLEHADLCRVFLLDPNRTKIEIPKSARDGGLPVGWFPIWLDGFHRPVAIFTVCRESDKFRDVDPRVERDFFL